MSEDVNELAHFFATSVTASAKKGGVSKVELAESISEIEIETQTTGASFLKVHIVDPEWTLATSGWLDVKEGLIQPIEVEFPEKSEWKWTICAVEVSTAVNEPNLIVTFEDRNVAYLRQYWTEKTAPAGTQTRAQFVQGLVQEVGQKGEEKIKFICPSLNILQPVETPEEAEGKKKSKTKSATEEERAQINKSRNTGKLTPDQYIFAGLLASETGLESKVIAAWCLEEESSGAAVARENEGNNNWLNIGYFSAGPGQIAFNDAFKAPETAARQTAKFLKGEWGGASTGIRNILKSTKGRGKEQIAAIVNSGWSGDNYASAGGLSGFESIDDEISSAESPPTTAPASEAVSDIGELKRGSPSNPSEDSWECCQRLAQAVDWYFFSNNKFVYYMDGPDFEHQNPAFYVDIPNNHVRKFSEKSDQGQRGVILAPTTVTFDNTTFEYRRTHKIKTRVQKKSRQIKPSSPSEVKLLLECPIAEYHAGDTFIVQNSGPANGLWLITDTKRNCLKDTWTEFIGEPPLEPLPEPKGEEGVTSSTGEGLQGVVNAAKKAYSEKSKYLYSESTNRGNNGTLFGPKPRTMDCSSFATLCYKAAGLPDPNGQNYTPIGDTGTLIAHSIKVEKPQPGDFCFYAGSIAFPRHVAIYIGNGRAIGMESPGVNLLEGTVAEIGPVPFLGYYRSNV